MILSSIRKTSLLFIALMLFTFGCSQAPLSQMKAAGNGSWDSPFTVDEAISNQDSSKSTVEGYIVGQPISENNVIKSQFPSDYALALADSASETDTSNMIYIQIPSIFRSTFGLQSNPKLMGEKIKVTGELTDYFSHAGVKSTSKIEVVEGDGSDPSDPTDPPSYEEYYQPAEGKTGAALKQSLHDIIDDHHELSYSDVWEALRNTDEDPNNPNNVLLLYSGRSQSELSNGGNVDDWNREHVWAKSHGDFGTSMGAGTDIHHLRPTDVTVNSSRSNLDFDNGGSPHREAPESFYDSDSWEPRDSVKGDVARMLFYMAVRYEGDVSDEVDLELNNYVNNGSDPYHGKLSVLLEWHEEDPVDEFERRRNNIIFEDYQGNRNPFIDHPEFAEMIW
jgi:endonuclease I